MLARIIESYGISTVIVTMMPVWSERLGAPRTLGVDHPFALPMGAPGDVHRQRWTLAEAMSVLEHATSPGEVQHSTYEWPDERHGKRLWHPDQPSPVVAELKRRGLLSSPDDVRTALRSAGRKP